MADILPMPLSPDAALRMIRDIAADSANVVIPDPPEAGEWESTVNYLQVLRCLTDGAIAGTPSLDALGNWECTLRRFSAGIEVAITVAVFLENNRQLIYVKNVEKRT